MTTAVLEKKIRPYERPVASDFMRWLLTHVPPRPITNQTLHRGYKAIVGILMEALEAGHFSPTIRRGLEEYVNVVAGLLADYERHAFPSKKATPAQVVSFLMEQHGLNQGDLAKDFGGQPAVSYFLNGKRALTRQQIERLSKRFHISPAAFF
jgi:HTH-type transcriptional regulator / antitoxin HigA